MAKTQITDVIVPDVFNPYIVERTPERSALIRSGIVAGDPELDALARSGGRIINMPFWNDLTGDDEVLSDSGSLTPAKIDAGQDKAVLYMRGKAWSVNDLAKALAGDDPMQAVADLVIDYWERRRQALLVSSLKGVFSAGSMSTNLLDISTETGAGDDVIDGDAIIDTFQLLGDRKDRLSAYMMHSKVVSKLAKDELIDYIPDSEGRPTLASYQGTPIIQDDNCPVSDGVYWTFVFGMGAFGLGNGQAPVPTETDRDSLAGDDILINRQHFLLHPRGVKWTDSSVAGSSPTNAEAETGANWERVYDQKNVRIVALKHRIVTAN